MCFKNKKLRKALELSDCSKLIGNHPDSTFVPIDKKSCGLGKYFDLPPPFWKCPTKTCVSAGNVLSPPRILPCLERLFQTLCGVFFIHRSSCLAMIQCDSGEHKSILQKAQKRQLEGDNHRMHVRLCLLRVSFSQSSLPKLERAEATTLTGDQLLFSGEVN